MKKGLLKKVIQSTIAFGFALGAVGCGNTQTLSNLIPNNNIPQQTNFSSYNVTADTVTKPYALLSYQSLDSNLGDIYDQTPAGDNYTAGQVTQFSIMSDLNALEAIGGNKNMGIFSWVDLSGKKDSYQSFIVQDNDPEKFSSELAPVKEKNMGYYKNLEKFLTEGMTRCQGKNVILDISSHGGGYWGISPDYSSKNKRISLEGMQLSLQRAITGKRKLDIMSFYACLMQGIEVNYQLRNDVKITLASGDVMTSNMGGSKTSYYKNFDIINQNPNISLENLAKHIVDNSDDNYASVFSAVKTGSTTPIVQAIDKLAGALIAIIPTRKKDIFKACAATPKYPNVLQSNFGTAEEYLKKNKPSYTQEDISYVANLLTDMVDIKALTKSLRTNLSDVSAVVSAIAEVDRTVDYAVLKSKTIKGTTTWGGLSIYLPFGLNKVENAYFQTAFAADTRWDTFLNLLVKQ